MYCNFFGLSEKPFDVTPDPKYLYLSLSHREILASLLYGIKQRQGFISIVGEVGTGKTTLLNALLDRLEPTIRTASVFNTDLTFKEILILALLDLGVIKSSKNITKSEAIYRLNQFAISQLAGGGNVAFIIDEAQNLNNRSLESLQLLSNLETRKTKLLQIVLCGQPEMDSKLAQPRLRQLSQRISLKRCAKPLDEKETYGYINHRLSIAEYKGPPLFEDQTLKLIWRHSGGIPRKINTLCDNALLIGFATEKRTIEVAIIKEVIRDLEWSPFANGNDSLDAIIENGIEAKVVGRKFYRWPVSTAWGFREKI